MEGPVRETAKPTIAVVAAAPDDLLSGLEAVREWHIVRFASLEELLSELAGAPPELVLLGHTVPDLAGWRGCRVLRSPEHAKWRGTRILLVSSDLSGDEPARITRALGGDGLVYWPEDAGRLAATIEGLLKRPATAAGADLTQLPEDRLHEAVRDGDAGYFRIGLDGRFEDVNRAWCRMHGYASPEEVIGLHYTATQVPEHVERARKVVEEVLAGSSVPSGQFTRKCQDGSTAYHTFSAHPVRQDGRVVGLEGFLIDTTRVRELEERYEWLFNSMLDGFALHEMIFDADGAPVDYRFLSVNPAFERMTGLTATAVVGRTVLEVLPGIERHWIENYGRVARTGEPFRFEAGSGDLGKHFEVIAYRPEPGRFACVFRDVTESKRHQAEIERLSRLYAVLSEVNQAIVRTRSQEELYRNVCSVAVEFGHFRNAWIGSIDPATGRMTVRGEATDAEGFPCRICADECGLVRAALLSEKPVVCNTLEPSQSAAACHVVALQSANIGSSAAFPVLRQGRVDSVLCLHARERGAFSDPEVRLVEEIALDVSYALDKLDSENRERQAREELSRSETLHRALFENINDALFLTRADSRDGRGRFIATNALASGMLGYSREEMLQLSPADIEEPGRDSGARGWGGKGAAKQETVYAAKDGRRIPVEISVQELEAGGERLRLYVVRDISERKRAEDALRRAQANLEAVVESTEDLIWSVNLDCELLTFNTALQKTIEGNFGRRVYAGVTPEDLYPPERARYWREAYRRTAAEGSQREEYATKGGRILELAFNRIVHDGQTTGISVFGKDVTARKETEDRLRASEYRYRLISENAADVIWTLDIKRGRFTYVSPSVQHLRGYTVEEALSQGLEDAFTAESCERLLKSLRERMEKRALGDESARESRTDRVDQTCKDGTTVATEVVTTLLCDDSRHVCELLGVSRDIRERRRAEVALEESERRLALTLDAVSDGLFDWDMVADRAYFSPRYYTMLGYTPDEFPASSHGFLSLVHPDDLGRLLESLQEYGDGRRDSHEIEIRMKTKAGGWRWILSRGRMVLRDSEGRPAQMIGTHVDITDRKRVEERLKESEEKFRKAFMTGADVFYIATLKEGLILDVNDRFEEVFGYTREEAIGRTSRELRLYADPDDRARAMAEVEAHGSVKDLELHGRRKSGELMTGLLSINRLDLGEDRIIGVVKDITDRKQAELALRESEERFSQAFERAPLMMAISDFETGVYLEVNGAFSSVTGFSREEAIGKTPLELGILTDETHAQLLRAVERGGRSEQQEISLRRKDGTTVVCSQEGVGINVGGIRRLLFIGMDLSAEKRQEAEKAYLEEQLRQSQKLESIGRLAGGIAHDFNNMLTVINGYSDLLVQELNEGDPLRDFARQIERAGEQAAGLTRQLLAFSRKQVIDPRPVNLGQLISESRDMLQRLLGEDFELETVLAADLGQVLADPGQLIQVVMNLVVNARDAMPAGGTVTVEASNVELSPGPILASTGLQPGAHVLLAVSDTGVGMDAETQAHIFEPFFTTKGEGLGTGLGLSTAYGLVRQFGGSISVESAPGCGATFRIYFPRLDADGVAGTGQEMVPEVARGSETILVVEDQEAVRKLVVQALKNHGYRVLEASNGAEALVVAERYPEPIHLLLTDVVMPRMKGRELAERVCRLRPATRVLYMSGYAEEMVAYRGLVEPGLSYIAKPFSPAALIRKVREVLVPAADRARTILVVDDEQQIRQLFQRFLEEAGFRVAAAANGREALEIMPEVKADVVVTDLAMPEAEGMETICRLRETYPEAKIIAVSGAFGREYLRVASLLGASVTLAKPVSAEQLIAAVRSVTRE
jgi:two-component system cell cycle sensor histidine kinase/response regulator CckA